MASAVVQLQTDALDRSIAVGDLLRRAFVIARKLGLKEFEAWISHELNGYGPDAAVPEYRMVQGEVRGWNPVRGWIPVVFESADEADLVSQRAVGQSIAELERLLDNRQPSGQFHIPLPHGAQRRLSDVAGFDTHFSLFVPQTSIVKIVDAVRNSLLNWSLQLEADGVLGEALAFTEKEKSVATSASYNVNNFFGPVGQADVQQAGGDAMKVSVSLDLQRVRTLANDIREALAHADLDGESKAEAEAELTTLEVQLASPKPKSGVIREALSSLKTILEGAGGSVAGHLLLELGKVVAGG